MPELHTPFENRGKDHWMTDSDPTPMHLNIGFVSTRFAGTDGVTLEASKWSDVLESNHHRCFWFAGELDRAADRCYRMPEAFFQSPANVWINERIVGRKERKPNVTQAIHDQRASLKAHLHRFIKRFDIDLLVVENALTIPMHVPLGLALTETIAETQIPTICHHHDFYWERVRFTVNAVNDYLRMSFPPNLPNIQHAVINSDAREQLALRTGITSTIVPNVIDFEHPPCFSTHGAQHFRQSIGLKDDDRVILQPTRIVQRKGIEHAIELVKALNDPRCKLVISHEAGDEGFEYAEWLKEYACEHKVDLRLVTTRISDPLRVGHQDSRAPSLWDVYPFADFITYPSLHEGFGNAFLEAIYFRKPMMVNRYAIFVRDIEPLGFDLALMDGYLSKRTVQLVQEILSNPDRRNAMVDRNYAIARRHYSYAVLRERLSVLLRNTFGDSVDHLAPAPREAADEGILDIAPYQVRYKRFNRRKCKQHAAS
jgi:glycosyltransferase involved in cell wall biosynthesis